MITPSGLTTSASPNNRSIHLGWKDRECHPQIVSVDTKSWCLCLGFARSFLHATDTIDLCHLNLFCFYLQIAYSLIYTWRGGSNDGELCSGRYRTSCLYESCTRGCGRSSARHLP